MADDSSWTSLGAAGEPRSSESLEEAEEDSTLGAFSGGGPRSSVLHGGGLKSFSEFDGEGGAMSDCVKVGGHHLRQ